MEIRVAIGAAIVLFLLRVLFGGKKNPVQTAEEGPLPLRDVSEAEWAELRALEELARRRADYEKRLSRARGVLAGPGAGVRAGGNDEMEGDSDDVN